MITTEVENAPAETNAQAGGAVIEVVERHKGPDRYSHLGSESVIAPNHVRINGVAVHCTIDDPVVVESVHIDGNCHSKFVVTLRMMARVVRIGDVPESIGGPAAEPSDKNRAAVLEIPLGGKVRPGQLVAPAVVHLNGSALYLGGPVKVERLRAPWGDDGAQIATVVVPLLCRRFLVDDEVIPADEVVWPSRQVLPTDDPGTGPDATTGADEPAAAVDSEVDRTAE